MGKSESKNRRAKGATLLETLISFSILTVIIIGAMGSYLFIIRDNKLQVQKTLAYKQCQQEMENLLSMSITNLIAQNNTIFNITFLEGLPPQPAGKRYVTDISSSVSLPAGSLYEIKIEINWTGNTDYPPLYVSLIARRARL